MWALPVHVILNMGFFLFFFQTGPSKIKLILSAHGGLGNHL